MAVIQNECYRVVTIGYLKNFISNLIQNSTGGTVTISRADDTYCPTYSELTGGSIVQTWSQGGTPNGDRDGIYVNPSAILGGNYANNQCVDQKDLGLRYTRFGTLSIGRSESGNISECGGSATLTYTYNYNRYDKYMNSSCNTATTSATVDSVCSQLAYHTTYGSVSNCTAYSIGKNGTVSASSRDDSIYADVTFRGGYHKSNTITITQNALTGSYSGSEAGSRNVPTNVTAYRVSPTDGVVGCDATTAKANATGYYDIYKTYYWVDSCGQEYTSISGGEKKTGSSSESVGEKTVDFDACGSATDTRTKSISFTYGSFTDSASFSQDCSNCGGDDPWDPPRPEDDPTYPKYNFAPLYPQSNDGYPIRGTNNGAEIRKTDFAGDLGGKHYNVGDEFCFVAPQIDNWDDTDDSDFIHVNTIYYVAPDGTKTDFKTTSADNPIVLGEGISIYYDPNDSNGWEYSDGTPGASIHIDMTPNTSDKWRTYMIKFATDDAKTLSGIRKQSDHTPYPETLSGKDVLPEWEWHIWQAPKGCTVSGTDPTGKRSGSHSGWSHCG